MLAASIAFLLASGLAMFGILSIIDPELAFRIENLFQIREVELTVFGRDLQRLGGGLCVLVAVFVSLSLFSATTFVLFLVVTASPFVYRYRDDLRTRSRTD